LPLKSPAILSNIIGFVARDAKELKHLQAVDTTFQDTVQFHSHDTHRRVITQGVLDTAGKALDRTILHNALELKLPLDYNESALAFARANMWNEVFAITERIDINLPYILL
jgi:hypothetical protein